MKRSGFKIMLFIVFLVLVAVCLITQHSAHETRAVKRDASTSTVHHVLVTHNQSLQKQPDVYTVLGKPTVSAQRIDHILCLASSPACGTGVALYQLGIRYGIDPIFALAFFQHESTFGRYGIAFVNKGLGNIRCSQGYACLSGFRAYHTWQDGYEDWYHLIRTLYVDTWGLTTVDTIVPRYAPSTENDTVGYITAIKHAVDLWRHQQ